MDKWFWKDLNAVPEEYVLQPIDHIMPSYIDESIDRNVRQKPWWDDFEAMQVILRKGSYRAFKYDNPKLIWKYFIAGKIF